MIQRRLQFQSLEYRNLLAGDVFIPSTNSDCDRSIDPAAAMGTVTVAEAGSSRDTAANLGTLDSTRRLRGELGGTDRIDMVRFNVSSDAPVELDLHQLNDNADLYLLDQQGRLLERSTRSGTRSEAIDRTLHAGEYFVAVVARSLQPIDYRLDLAATIAKPVPAKPVPAEPVPAEPVPAEPVPAEPAPTPPPADDVPPPQQAPIKPLTEVPYFGTARDWNVNLVGAPEAWAAGYRGQGVTVAVIDTGVDLDHPDLVNNLFVNPGEIAGNGLDDDQNGLVDDVTGYDFAAGDSRPNDIHGHGTHVAGTIAAADNGYGATGIAPQAQILPIRVLGDDGSGSPADVAAGIRYAAEMGAQIINLSLGGGYSRAIESAVSYAQSLGSLIVAAAGNAGATRPGYPARFSANSNHVISVGAHDKSAGLADFSNRVGDSNAIQVDAPGVGIYSTYSGGRYARLSGTSMATPHVAGLAALTLSSNPDLTSPQLRELLTTGVMGSATRSDSIGIADARKTVAYAAAGWKSVVASAIGSAPEATSLASESLRAANKSRFIHPVESGTPTVSRSADAQSAELRQTVRTPQTLTEPESRGSITAFEYENRTLASGDREDDQILEATDDFFSDYDLDGLAKLALGDPLTRPA